MEKLFNVVVLTWILSLITSLILSITIWPDAVFYMAMTYFTVIGILSFYMMITTPNPKT